MHTRQSQLSRGTKLNTCRQLLVRSHQSLAPALPPCARALPSTGKHGAPGCAAAARPPPLHQPLCTPAHTQHRWGTDRLQPGPGHPPANPAPSDPLLPELLLQQGVFQPSKHTPVPQKPVGPRNKVCLPVDTQRLPSPETRLSCRCSVRSNTYLLRLPQVVLGSAREEIAGQVLELAQPLPRHWQPRDAAPARGEPWPAGTAPWLSGESQQPG